MGKLHLCGLRRRIPPGTIHADSKEIIPLHHDGGLKLKNPAVSFPKTVTAATLTAKTKTSPFETLSGRKMNIGISGAPKDPIPTLVHTHIAENDSWENDKMKTSVDIKRRTKLSPPCLGDKVLVRQKKNNKLYPPYNRHHFTVIKKNGSIVTAHREDYQLLFLKANKPRHFSWRRRGRVRIRFRI